MKILKRLKYKNIIIIFTLTIISLFYFFRSTSTTYAMSNFANLSQTEIIARMSSDYGINIDDSNFIKSDGGHQSDEGKTFKQFPLYGTKFTKDKTTKNDFKFYINNRDVNKEKKEFEKSYADDSNMKNNNKITNNNIRQNNNLKTKLNINNNNVRQRQLSYIKTKDWTKKYWYVVKAELDAKSIPYVVEYVHSPLKYMSGLVGHQNYLPNVVMDNKVSRLVFKVYTHN